MIGRIDSTQGRWWASFLAVAMLVAVVGVSTTQAQGPRAKAQGVVPDLAVPPALPPSSSGSLEPPADPGPPPPDLVEGPAKVDDQVEPAQAADDGKSPLPPALPASGGAPAAPGAPSASTDSDPFAIQPDRLSPGRQRVQLSVDVQAQPVINLGKESVVKLVVKNESNTDASGVSVVYQLPKALQLVSSTPEATPVPADSALYWWKKPMLAAGSEWVIILKVLAKEASPCEHAATVTAKTGSKASATVQEPKLKVEAVASPGRQLKGGQVTFTIAVRNPGTGPARDVIVQAKLSSGLRMGRDDIVEQTISEIKPGQRIELEPLMVDTVAGGPQTCTVEARSPDVNTVVEDQRVTRSIEVTQPQLALKLAGQEHRYTGQTIEYKLSVTNPGTSPAKMVKVAAALPSAGGRLVALPSRAEFDKKTRKLFWALDQIEPGQTVDLSFVYMTSTPGLYRATAEATSGELRASETHSSDVSGIAVLDLVIEQTARVIDVGKTSYYDITIKNVGSKEATRLQLSGKLTTNLKVLRHFNVEKGEFQFNTETGQFIFPEIDRLGVGQSITLSLEVQATESGPAGCHAFLAHAEMENEGAKVEDVLSTTVTGGGRPRSSK
ncbi:hypothetical protein P12x_000585 [Tundrisphaera lichenicola]|uniref:hypothetical protein n=1 Tax=Tundrisphaera lichenicola TaxID=2029860 RepID=UPI003EBD8053